MFDRAWPALFAAVVISFLLPWVAISCQGRDMVTATGTQIILDRPETPIEDMFGEMGMDDTDSPVDMDELDSEEMAGAPIMSRIGTSIVLFLALAGLMITAIRPALGATVALAVGGVQTALLLGAWAFGPDLFKDRIREAAAADSGASTDSFEGIGEAMGRMMLEGIELEFRIGFFIALAASIGLVGLALYRRQSANRAPIEVPPAATEPSGIDT